MEWTGVIAYQRYFTGSQGGNEQIIVYIFGEKFAVPRCGYSYHRHFTDDRNIQQAILNTFSGAI